MSLYVVFTPPRIGDIGGVEAHTLQLSRHLAKAGNKVSVVCAKENAGSREDLASYANVQLLTTAFKIQNTNITPALPFALAKTRADIIHTMIPTPWSDDWSAIIAKLSGKKFVVTIHSDLYAPTLLGGLVTRLYVETFYRLVLALADRIIIVNPDYKKTFVHTRHVLAPFAKKIVAIPNGVDISAFVPSRRKKSGKRILFVSVLDDYHEFKGLSYLIKAMPEVAKKVPGAVLTVVGGGPLKEKYENLAKELGLGKSVSFVGAKPNNSLPSLYSGSDVFVLPSVDTEAFGIVLLEAMASGTPVVTTEYAGMKEEILKKKCGVVVPSRNSGALANAIITLLKNKKLAAQMAKNGRLLTEKEYSWSNVAAQTIKLYLAVEK